MSRRVAPGVLAAVAVGGAVGGGLRYLISSLGGLPWTTLVINTVGCALIGVLMVLLVDRWPDTRLVRPLLGTGVLGGFTTFSTYALDVERLLSRGQVATALGYLVATPVLALVAVWAAATSTRLLIRLLTRRRASWD
jgi:CrcB protein